MKRRMGRRRMMRSHRRPIVTIKRQLRLGSWVFDSASVAGFWRYEIADLGGLPQIGDFVQCFEEYKINAVKYSYYPNFDSISAADATSSVLPAPIPSYQVMTCIDKYTASPAPAGAYGAATLATFLAECPNTKKHQYGKPFHVYYRPTQTDDVNNVAAAKYRKSQWNRVANITLPHFGHHAFIWGEGGFAVPGLSHEIFVTFYMQFRGTR